MFLCRSLFQNLRFYESFCFCWGGKYLTYLAGGVVIHLEKFAKDVCLCLWLLDMVKYLQSLLCFGLQMRALVQGRIIVLGRVY